MKKLIVCLCLFLLTGCSQSVTQTFDQEVLDIVVASDLHYFDPDLYAECDWFEEALLQGDGKMVADGDEIIDTFIDQMLIRQPDLIILSGDLTFNGELSSHQKLASKLNRLKEANIEVTVIPGNHDLNNFFSKGYGADGYFKTPTTTLEDFKSIYASFGYHLAYNKDTTSASYVLSLNETYDLIMLDDGTSSTIKEETKQWLTEQLVRIRNKQKTPLIVMHHNLAIHNTTLHKGFTITQNEEYANLFKQYEVPFVLSGHIHVQHMAQVEGIYDIVTSSLLNAPLQYGTIQLTNNSMHYLNEQLTISKDPNTFFDQTSFNSFYEQLTVIKDEQDRLSILNMLVDCNRAYFAGHLALSKENILSSESYQLITSYKEQIPFIYEYLQSMLLDDVTHNELYLEY